MGTLLLGIYTLIKKNFGALGLILGIASLIVFVLTEKIPGDMQMTDKWTWLMAIILVIGIWAAVLLGKKEKE